MEPIKATLEETTKHPLRSKTVWLQIVALLSVLVPAVRDWLAANPVEFVAVLGAVNVLVRFVTSGRISIFSGDEPPADTRKGGNLGGFLMLGLAAGLCATALPSCAVPVKACVVTDHGMVCYSSKGGLSAEIDATK